MTVEQITPPLAADAAALRERFRRVRALSRELCEPLQPEDFRIQSMPDVSPPWWNLGHTSWFFAKNILEPRTGFAFPSPGFEYVLNSYYEAHGERVPRHERGLQGRPTTDEILAFRKDVDRRMEELLDSSSEDPELHFLTTTGIEHEQQHQELLVTEIKHILGTNARSLRPLYSERRAAPSSTSPSSWIPFEGGLYDVGNLEGSWCWDNELPVHKTWIDPFSLASRLVTVGEYLQFMEDDGYRRALLWMSNGWGAVGSSGWEAPLYWERDGDTWTQWTLNGQRELEVDEPVSHVSFYEADAFANWRALQEDGPGSVRLPTEREWEVACRTAEDRGALLDDEEYHPQSARGEGLSQMIGDLWEWTSSHYEPYPNYRPFAGDLQEYNGKFMDNQRVLRGGSCATPADHIRSSYRNFWPGDTRFQFTGIRLARAAT
ncbi:MAG: ergothioneine biosynthesis protein EgtB [Acidobacteriota bacterium]